MSNREYYVWRNIQYCDLTVEVDENIVDLSDTPPSSPARANEDEIVEIPIAHPSSPSHANGVEIVSTGKFKCY